MGFPAPSTTLPLNKPSSARARKTNTKLNNRITRRISELSFLPLKIELDRSGRPYRLPVRPEGIELPSPDSLHARAAQKCVAAVDGDSVHGSRWVNRDLQLDVAR